MASKATTELGTLLVSRKGYRDGRPCLRGTGMTVHQVAAAHMMGYSAEEICAQNPDLDPSLFYAALAYYFANREQVEADIEADAREYDELAKRYPNGIGPNDPRE
ncbi:MAG TPA: DUF433 domain-containing protein [Dehalococcoidia bacterium]|nr:DUF433 domain-containing protein [Dehalococcoidia bacterium]